MTEISRRNFLKGAMAAAGVIAVGLPPEIAAVAPPVPPSEFPASIEIADLWFDCGAGPRFIGKLLSAQISWHVVEVPSLRGYVEHGHAGSFDGRIDAAVDAVGHHELTAALDSHQTVIFIFGGQIHHRLQGVRLYRLDWELGSSLVTSIGFHGVDAKDWSAIS